MLLAQDNPNLLVCLDLKEFLTTLLLQFQIITISLLSKHQLLSNYPLHNQNIKKVMNTTKI